MVAQLMALSDTPKMADILQKSPILNHKLPASSIRKGSPVELINVINKAKKYGKVIIGLLSDKAIAEYKRLPLINYNQRLIMIKNLKNIYKVDLYADSLNQETEKFVSFFSEFIFCFNLQTLKTKT